VVRGHGGDCGNRFWTRLPLRIAAIGSALLLLGFAAGSAHAAEPLLTPPGFTLHASNGYTFSVMAGQDRTGRGFAFVTARSPHSEAFYFAPASVSATGIEADLGAVGRIDVDFAPTGRPRAERSICGGKPVSVDSGRYEGSIDFEGEEGYSEVHASAARGEAMMALSLVCPSGPLSEGTGGHSPGARLTVKHGGSRRFEFSAMKNSPTRPARLTASVSEKRGGLFISRGVEITAGPDAFDFDVPAGTARVSPPEPFTGQASYVRPRGRRSSWLGDLRVDFPGRSNVRLTGPGTRANLMRAVLNPGHPFRIP
jgi:hypothetical protein